MNQFIINLIGIIIALEILHYAIMATICIDKYFPDKYYVIAHWTPATIKAIVIALGTIFCIVYFFVLLFKYIIIKIQNKNNWRSKYGRCI